MGTEAIIAAAMARADAAKRHRRAVASLTPGPYNPVTLVTTNGQLCIGVDHISGVSCWSSASTIYLSSNGGTTRTADPGGNLGKPPGVTGSFKVLNFRRQGTQAFWLCMALDAGTNVASLFRAPIVAPGVALVWTLIDAGQATTTAATFGLDCSNDGTVICWGEYSTTITIGLARIRRSANSGTSFSTAFTVSSTSKHMHDIAHDPYRSGVWYATAGDGPLTTTNYFLKSTDDGVTWTPASAVTTFPPGFQSVAISVDNPSAGRGGLLYLAPDITWCDLITVDPATSIPKASHANHNLHSPVPNPGTYSDITTTSGSPNITALLSTPFNANDPGRRIFGPNIPAGTTILSQSTSQAAIMSANATASATSTATITIDRGERWQQNVFMGRLDAVSGDYYFVTNDDASSPGGCASRIGLFCLRAGETVPILLNILPQSAQGVWIEQVNNRVYAGHISRTLLSSVAPA